MSQFEIIAAPFTVWLAPVGEAFTDLDTAAPAGNWVKLGVSGDKNITEDGVTVAHPQTLEYYRGLGATGPLKAFRTEEDLMISFVLADMTMEAYTKALNDKAVADTVAGSGTAGTRQVALLRGLSVAEHALLVRNELTTPYLSAGKTQYEVPRVVQEGEPEVVFVKGEPAGLEFNFKALMDMDQLPGDEFGKIITIDAAALP